MTSERTSSDCVESQVTLVMDESVMVNVFEMSRSADSEIVNDPELAGYICTACSVICEDESDDKRVNLIEDPRQK